MPRDEVSQTDRLIAETNFLRDQLMVAIVKLNQYVAALKAESARLRDDTRKAHPDNEGGS